jgi:hypothetical protein
MRHREHSDSFQVASLLQPRLRESPSATNFLQRNKSHLKQKELSVQQRLQQSIQTPKSTKSVSYHKPVKRQVAQDKVSET